VSDLSASGTRWAVATPHVAATEAAVRAFETGGNAIDAALAAAVTLAVVYPHMCGVGGDLFALVRRRDGDVIAVSSTGAAPSGLDAEAIRTEHTSMPERGPLAVTVPGAVAGWEAMHGQGGDLPWSEAFSAGIEHARAGVPVSRSLARTLDEVGSLIVDDPGLRNVFLRDGAPIGAGETFANPALARTLETLAADGARALYRGEIGRSYSEGLRKLGCPMTPDDLAAHRAELLAPLVGRYRDLDVRVPPPTSQGFVLLELLGALERLGIDPDPLGPDAATIALAALVAARDRDLHLADPEHMRVHPHALLDDGHLAALCDQIRSGSLPRTRPAPSDTVGLVTADAHGLAVSLIQSLSWGMGAGILEPSTGIVAQNRGSGFALDPEHPNALAPGKRPAHTLMPVMAHRGGRLAAVSGTMGGAAHPQINAWSLIRAFDLGMDPASAVAAPRWLVNGMDVEGPEPFVLAEAGVADRVLEALRRTGFRLDIVGAVDESVGHAHLLRVNGAFEVGSDPRADGSARAM
jgi:gamma-glutamyltranspeptidase